MSSYLVDGLLDSALAHHRCGNLAEADAIYCEILKHDPRNADAMHLRGVIAHQRGDHEAAVRAIENALILSPDNPTFLSNLGLCYRDAGKPAEAESRLLAALQVAPGLVEAMNNLATVLIRQRRWPEAEGWCRRAIALEPAYADAYDTLGSILADQGQPEQAIQHFRAALNLNPDFSGAMVNLACSLVRENALSEAEAWCRRAIAIEPSLAEAYNALGMTLCAAGRVQEAIESYEQSLRLNPDLAETHHNLGYAYGNLGQFDRAEQEYAAALRLSPDDVKPYYSMAVIHRFSPEDRAVVTRIESALAQGGLTAFERRQLHFALGKACDDLGDYERAFHHFHLGNELARRPFDRTAHAAWVDQLQRWFSKSQFWHTRETYGTDLPVFIVGVPRSGTSLVEQILATHPQIHGCGELPEVNSIAASCWSDSGHFIGDSRLEPQLDGDLLASLADAYLRRRQAEAGRAVRITDKMPTNYFHLGLIALLFPGARVIHCRRDPLDTCLSCYFNDFKKSPAYHNRLDDLGFNYRLYLGLMEHWKQVLPLPILEVQYEELVGNIEEVSRRMVSFCGVPWDPAVLRYYENTRSVQTSSLWQVRQPIYHRAIGRWKHYARHLNPLLRELGSLAPAEAASLCTSGQPVAFPDAPPDAVIFPTI
jgi:tetratricopeptide (TPR) repeat protein